MNNPEHHNIIVLGAGASGLMASISAAAYSDDVILIDSNTEAGRKLLATGNGKCNFTNLNVSVSDFRSNDPETAYRIYSKFDVKNTMEFFSSIGIPGRPRDGYIYPYSGRAASVREALVNEAVLRGVKMRYEVKVRDIVHKDNKYIVNNDLSCDKLILAMGGNSAKVFGSQGSGTYLAGRLGLKIRKTLPALVGLKTDFGYCDELNGVRTECAVSITVNSVSTEWENGEIIFNKGSISGIPVMNMSSMAVRGLSEDEKVTLHIDLFPTLSEAELSKMILLLAEKYPEVPAQSVFLGLINEKLLSVLLKLSSISPEHTLRTISKTALAALAHTAKNLSINITGDNGFENSQVTSGGVLLTEIDPDTMESVKLSGLYIVGETLDVDGRCGGYNLQWAWTTGAIAGGAAAGGRFDKDKLIKG